MAARNSMAKRGFLFEAFGTPMWIGAEGMLFNILSAVDLLATHRLLH